LTATKPLRSCFITGTTCPFSASGPHFELQDDPAHVKIAGSSLTSSPQNLPPPPSHGLGSDPEISGFSVRASWKTEWLSVRNSGNHIGERQNGQKVIWLAHVAI
jgi:hypothetical protein